MPGISGVGGGVGRRFGEWKRGGDWTGRVDTI